MKVYATIESERARKGQGGERVNVVLSDANRIAQYVITYTPDLLEVRGAFDNDYLLRIPQGDSAKGEKQKGARGECAVCEAPLGKDKTCPYGC